MALLDESLRRVEEMVACESLQGTLAGTGPDGVIEVSDRVKSLDYFLHMPFNKKRRKNDTLMNEFVWDPINIRFATIRGPGPLIRHGGSPHQSLAYAIGADHQLVCGGIIRFAAEGDNQARSLLVATQLNTCEFSGHFHQNWTDRIRAQYVKYMQLRTGLIVNHHPGM